MQCVLRLWRSKEPDFHCSSNNNHTEQFFLKKSINLKALYTFSFCRWRNEWLAHGADKVAVGAKVPLLQTDTGHRVLEQLIFVICCESSRIKGIPFHQVVLGNKPLELLNNTWNKSQMRGIPSWCLICYTQGWNLVLLWDLSWIPSDSTCDSTQVTQPHDSTCLWWFATINSWIISAQVTSLLWSGQHGSGMPQHGPEGFVQDKRGQDR